AMRSARSTRRSSRSAAGGSSRSSTTSPTTPTSMSSGRWRQPSHATDVPARGDRLASWRDTPARRAIVEFVEAVTRLGPGHVPPEERVAVFDNDGTLWCEKPMPIELGFILGRLAEMADADPALRE